MIRVASLLGLLIEDDRNFLGQMLQLLPRTISNFDIHWDSSDEFDNAIERIMRYRYDIIVTDVYANAVHKGKTPGDNKANDIVAAIRKTRMCPIFVYSSGSCPDSIEKEQGPFLIYADKAHPKFAKTLSDELHHLIKTGIPGIARRLHDELDAVSGPSFLWTFLQDH
uniref:Response regulator receiver domain-containing protein n=1 Tax=Candidatus Kentrum sp. LFY TaxID=2126342 RepID=A0A450WJI5_9GAMM|nr:MAG: hypothetical protein BECKLFY1418C_GA0070996_102927 [Candidatus Kentron sp. LFY]